MLKGWYEARLMKALKAELNRRANAMLDPPDVHLASIRATLARVNAIHSTDATTHKPV